MNLNVEQITEKNPFWDRINWLAKEAFPPEEYLAPEKLVEMARSENFDFWALMDEQNFVGFMVVQLYKELSYLFFLAVDPSCRSKGYGGRAIETLKTLYPQKQQVVDFEMLDASAPNKMQREKRRNFYLRNGYQETGLFLSYLGVDYEVFCMDTAFDVELFQEMMSTLNIDGFNPRYFKA